MFSTPGRSAAWPETTLLRMGTLCSLAASAIDRLESQFAMAGEERPNGNECHPFPDEPWSEFGDEPDRDGQRVMPSVQDATFLNAVLPFLMSQARRYQTTAVSHLRRRGPAERDSRPAWS